MLRKRLRNWKDKIGCNVNSPKMRALSLLVFLPLLGSGQSSETPPKDVLTKIYLQAISDFIKAANKQTGKSFDTLYFGKRREGEPDDFPEIELPIIIEKTQIRLITPEEGKKSQNAVKTRVYINMIGWVNKKNAEFKFFVFSNGFAHQYNYTLNYNYDVKKKAYELFKSEYQGPPFDK